MKVDARKKRLARSAKRRKQRQLNPADERLHEVIVSAAIEKLEQAQSAVRTLAAYAEFVRKNRGRNHV